MTAPGTLSRQEEAALVLQARHDPEAFGTLYEHYVERIYNYIYYRTGNSQDAEDLTSRVFHRALAKIDDYEDRGLPFSAWLYRIAHNLVANWHRDRSRRNIVPLDEFVLSGAPEDAPEAQAEANADCARLMELVRNLPPERQQVLILKFVEYMPNAEIGKVMGRTEGAVKSLYHRTLIALRDDFKSQEEAAKTPRPQQKEGKRRWWRP